MTVSPAADTNRIRFVAAPATDIEVRYWTVTSPIGELLLVGTSSALTGLYMVTQSSSMTPEVHWERDDSWFGEVSAQLTAYFDGELSSFVLTVAPTGTEFQRRVWSQLALIPYGRTVSYGELAAEVGNPRAMRAVGTANGRNPIAVIVPCHRVIAAGGGIGGYGGGLERKRLLLDLEQGVAPYWMHYEHRGTS
jgi:methylated-DNA-[protein]-cysteine S-methyltransferase